jgi:hypothetical protein
VIAGSPRIERAIKRGVRKLLRKDRALWKEFKIRNRSRQSNLPPWTLSAIFPVLLIGRIAAEQQSLLSIGLGLTLYATGRAIWRSNLFTGTLFSSIESRTPFFLPMDEKDFLRLQIRREFWNSMWTLLLFAAIYEFSALRFQPNTTGFVLAGAAALCQWLVVFSGTLLSCSRWFGKTKGLWFVGLNIAALIVLFWPQPIEPFIKLVPWEALLLAPAGWISIAFQFGVLNGQWAYCCLALPPLALALFIPSSIRRLYAMYQITELSIGVQGQTALLLTKNWKTLEPVKESARQKYFEAVQAAQGIGNESRSLQIEERIRRRSFLGELSKARLPAMERIIFSWLSPHECKLVEFLTYDDPGWTRAYKRMGGMLAILSTIALIDRAFFYYALWFGGMFLWPFILNSISTWPGLRSMNCGGKFIPFYAAYPVTFDDISRVYIVVNLTRCITLLPFALGFGAMIGYAFKIPPASGMAGGSKVIALLMALQPAFAAMRIFLGTDRFESIDWRSLPYIFMMLCYFIFFGINAVLMWTQGDIYVLVCAILVVLASGLFWLLSRVMYNRWSVDLVRKTGS